MEITTDICSICQDEIEGTKNLMITECNHKFHSTCYLRYTATTRKVECPMCRNNCLEILPSATLTLPHQIATVTYRGNNPQEEALSREYERFLNDEIRQQIVSQYYEQQAMERARSEEIRLNIERMELRRQACIASETENLKTYDPNKYFLMKKGMNKNIKGNKRK